MSYNRQSFKNYNEEDEGDWISSKNEIRIRKEELKMSKEHEKKENHVLMRMRERYGIDMEFNELVSLKNNILLVLNGVYSKGCFILSRRETHVIAAIIFHGCWMPVVYSFLYNKIVTVLPPDEFFVYGMIPPRL